MPYKKGRIKKLIGFTPEEWEMICRKSEAAKLRTGTFIRRMALNGELKFFDHKRNLRFEKSLSFNRIQSQPDRKNRQFIRFSLSERH